MKQTSILLAEAEAETSHHLLNILTAAKDLRVVDCATSGGQTFRLVRTLEPDILLLDLVLPDMDGLHLLRQLDYTTKTRTIILTDRATPNMLTQAVVLGARGAVDRFAPPAILLKSIRSVAEGEFWFSRDVTRVLLKYLMPDGGQEDWIPEISRQLTPRESDVLIAATWGLSNRQIANKLDVSEHTVKQHLKQIFEKLKVSSRVELVLLAMKLRSQSASSGARSKEPIRRHRSVSR